MTEYFPSNIQSRMVPVIPVNRARGTGFFAVGEIMNELIDFKPDVVFTDFPAYPNWYAKLYSEMSRRRLPLVALLRGDVWTEYSVYFKHAPTLTKLVRPLYQLSWASGLSLSDRILTLCGWLKEIVARRMPDKRVEVFHEGIDARPWIGEMTDKFPFKSPCVGILQDNNILPKVRQLVWFANVAREMPKVNFYIAGGGEHTPLVEEAFRRLPNAHLLGRLPYPQGVRKFYESIDVYVLPSGLDCCPATLLEASVCERPVVASNVGGIPELIKEGLTGFLLPNGNTRPWIEKLQVLLSDTRLSRRMGRAGRQFVLGDFSWEIQAPRLASILEQESQAG
ncbi:MAG: glycosyltransferase family 4 protein [Candidatus Bathyarchaeia archaeon]|jgi:glycosyltransferase involved in cell wall biosynthesis